jgi:hypothetical protein
VALNCVALFTATATYPEGEIVMLCASIVGVVATTARIATKSGSTDAAVFVKRSVENSFFI